MNTINIKRYEFATHGAFDDFEDLLHYADFKYNTNHLAMAGMEPEEIMHSINQAIKVCRLNGIDPADHFRSLYIFDENDHNTWCDWRMTRQGFALVIINTPPGNSVLARWQWLLVNNALDLGD